MTHYTLASYTDRAASTAEPRAYDLEYLLPGLLGELGELTSEFAKQHWHGTDRSEGIVLEYGDLAWLTAILLKREDVTDCSDITPISFIKDRDAALELLLGRVASVYRSGADVLALRAACLWVALRDLCPVVTGSSWDEVLTANLDKLAARAQAGTLHTHE